MRTCGEDTHTAAAATQAREWRTPGYSQQRGCSSVRRHQGNSRRSASAQVSTCTRRTRGGQCTLHTRPESNIRSETAVVGPDEPGFSRLQLVVCPCCGHSAKADETLSRAEKSPGGLGQETGGDQLNIDDETSAAPRGIRKNLRSFRTLTAALLLECLPLRPPSDGWAANWVFWVRFQFTEILLQFVGGSLVHASIPDLNFTVGKRLSVALGASLAITGTGLIAASTIGFPVPFIRQFGVIPVAFYVMAMTRLVLGPEMFARNSHISAHFQRLQSFFSAYMMLFGIFPLYKVLYELIPASFRGVTVIILPVWRFAARHYLVRATRNLEDYLPVFVALSVDFFSILFVTVCVSASSSIYLSVLFIAADVLETALEFRDLRANARSVLKLCDEGRIRSRATKEKRLPADNADLVSTILAVARDPARFGITSIEGVRLRGCLPHPLPEERRQRLNALEAAGIYRRCSISARRQTDPRRRQRKLRHFLHQVVPVSPAPIHLETSQLATKSRQLSPSDHSTDRQQAEVSKNLVHQGLQLLFHCEYLTLVEYVECIVPLVFVVYKSILEHLPNVDYYPGGAGHWSIRAVVNILVFATLELGSLLLLYVYLHRKFAFSPLYQLAHVLETEMYVVQACLFPQIVILLQYEVEHLGADFSLRFEWLPDKNN